MRAGRIGVIVTGVLLAAALAWASDPVAVLTEMQAGRARSRSSRRAADWQSPKPLLSLRAGDQVRAVGEARAVLVFTGGRGTQLVTRSNSPFAVPPAPARALPTAPRPCSATSPTSCSASSARRRTSRSRCAASAPSRRSSWPRATRGCCPARHLRVGRLRPAEVRVSLLGPQGAVVWEQAGLERRRCRIRRARRP